MGTVRVGFVVLVAGVGLLWAGPAAAQTPTLTATPTHTPTMTNTPTHTQTVTPTSCGNDPPQVDPVTSPTDLLQQTITGTGRVTGARVVVASSLGGCQTVISSPSFEISCNLLPNQVNEIEVCIVNLACGPPACTRVDRNGDPLDIVQVSPTPTPTPTNTPTSTPTFSPFGVSGGVFYYSNLLPVGGTTIQLEGPTTETTQTNAVGLYAFTDIGGESWRIEPRKTGGFNSAITALDAVFALQSRVGLRNLTPEQHLACDVTGNGTVNALDAAVILQLKVGLISQFPVAQLCQSDWVFVPVPEVVPNQEVTQPLMRTGSCQAGAIEYEPLSSQASGQDFFAVLWGDCTGDWEPATTPTVTNTPTSTSTATSISTDTPTNSPTSTPTSTPTRTATVTPT